MRFYHFSHQPIKKRTLEHTGIIQTKSSLGKITVRSMFCHRFGRQSLFIYCRPPPQGESGWSWDINLSNYMQGPNFWEYRKDYLFNTVYISQRQILSTAINQRKLWKGPSALSECYSHPLVNSMSDAIPTLCVLNSNENTWSWNSSFSNQRTMNCQVKKQDPTLNCYDPINACVKHIFLHNAHRFVYTQWALNWT